MMFLYISLIVVLIVRIKQLTDRWADLYHRKWLNEEFLPQVLDYEMRSVIMRSRMYIRCGELEDDLGYPWNRMINRWIKHHLLWTKHPLLITEDDLPDEDRLLALRQILFLMDNTQRTTASSNKARRLSS